jgi:hypothetical protein
MEFFKQLRKDIRKDLRGGKKWSLQVAVMSLGLISIGVVIGLLGVIVGGVPGDMLVISGIIIALIGSFIATGVI